MNLEFANRRSSCGQTDNARSFRTTSTNSMRFQKALQNARLTLLASGHYLAISFKLQPSSVIVYATAAVDVCNRKETTRRAGKEWESRSASTGSVALAGT